MKSAGFWVPVRFKSEFCLELNILIQFPEREMYFSTSAMWFRPFAISAMQKSL